MRRLFAVGLTVGLFAVVLSCWDSPLPTSPSQRIIDPRRTHSTNHCTATTYAQLEAQVTTIYGAGAPALASALSDLQNMQQFLNQNPPDQQKAEQAAMRLLDGIVRAQRNPQTQLPGYTEARFLELTNNLLCYVRLADLVGEVLPTDEVFLIESDDNPNNDVALHSNGLGGIEIPDNAYNGIILVLLRFHTQQYAPGTGPLKTDFDQHPVFMDILTTWTGTTSGDFLAEFLVGLCTADLLGNLPPGFEDHGAVGHGGVLDTREFEITKKQPKPGWLPCPPPEQSSGSFAGTRKQSTQIASADFHLSSRSGFGGSAINNSTFGLIDARSGFGGSAINNSPTEFGAFSHGAPVFTCGNPAPGTRAACDPRVQVATPLFFDHTSEDDGYAFQNVGVTFASTVNGSAGGEIAEKLSNGECSTTNKGQSITVVTDANGEAAVCWHVGGPGENKVVATPTFTGDLAGYQNSDATAANYVTFLPPSIGEWTINVVSVSLTFDGFYRPVRNPSNVNRVKAGSSVPVKFSLGDNFGLNVFAAGYPASTSISCNSITAVSTLDNIATEDRPPTTGLSFSVLSYQYTYVWKTDKNWAGTCRALSVKFTGGQEAIAYFNFFK